MNKRIIKKKFKQSKERSRDRLKNFKGDELDKEIAIFVHFLKFNEDLKGRV